MIQKEYRVFWKYVLGILAKRDYCERQIRQKLQQREATPDCIEHIIARLQALNYLDELRFAQSFFRIQLRRGQALKLVAYKAQQKGIARHCIAQVMAEQQGIQDVLEVCVALILKRDPQCLYRQDMKTKLRLMRFLQRRGFDTDSIQRAFYDLEQET